VSEFFESGGVVTILRGDATHPGLEGKIVWDTVGNSAMLQILNFPPDLGKLELEVNAVRDGRRERVAGFRADAPDSGNVLYHFFPVDLGDHSAPDEFTVAAGDRGGPAYLDIMSGSVPSRQ
jgi:hypothetical protein